MKEMNRLTVNGQQYRVADEHAVCFTQQHLTQEQQALARENIAAGMAGRLQSDGGEIFNNYQRNKARMRGHAVNDRTEAGWRSLAAGFYTYADNTGFAGGRLTRATGVGALAHGLEISGEIYRNGVRLATTGELTMHSTQIPVNLSVTGLIGPGDYICINLPNGNSTDCRQVAAVSEDGLTLTLDDPFYEPLQPAYANQGIDQDNLIFPAGTTVRLAQLCEATGNGSVALGCANHASGSRALAAGQKARAAGDYSAAFNFGTTATGTMASARGNQTTAAGDGADASGNRTVANGYCQSVRGRRNIPDGGINGYTYLEIVGNGLGENNSNAYTLDWEGNGWFAGTVEGRALILSSPGGLRFQITVSDAGQLNAAKI